jgi:ADP-ribose pyrophosphatase YjhB (NUDIX family)
MPTSPYLARLRGQVAHELVMLPGVSAYVFDAAGRVLLAHHVDSGIWALPGGAVEPDEDPAAAAAREAREDAARRWQEPSVAGPGNPAQRRVRAARLERS